MHIHRETLVVAAAAACLAAPAARADATPYTPDAAVHRFHDGQWADASYGPTLHEACWNATPHEIRRWQQLAASGQGGTAPQFIPDLYLDDQ